MADENLKPDIDYIPRAPLRGLAEDGRFRHMDTCEAYYRGKQDDAKMYDWDGRFQAYGSRADIKPGWYVPHRMRKPCTRYDMAKLIVRRLTSMVFGQDHFPEIRIEGDEDAEDYARTLCTESRLKVRMAEARNMGGAMGTAVLSFGFVGGRPRIKVHNPKHVKVLSWADQEELRPAAVLKAYSYPRWVFDTTAKKWKQVDYWCVDFWDQTHQRRWKDIPPDVASKMDWQNAPHDVFIHDYGFCPVYWIQNRPCSAEFDGEGDFEGLEETLDEMNRLLSATTTGTRANVDPTLVIKMDPSANTGQVMKGSQNAIFSPGGAEYLELKGTAVQAAERQLERLRSYVLDVAGVVLAEPEKLSGAAQSARALEILYAPMLANCDILREQYGEHGIKAIVLDMMRVARRYESSPATPDPESRDLIQARVMLPPRIVRDEETGAESTQERTPGESEQLVLNWRPYFAPTWTDVRNAASAMKEANGGKATVSRRTSVQAISTLVGVEDVDAEVRRIEEESEADVKRAQKAFGGMPSVFDDPAPPGAQESD